jgi:alpha-methylacyl-CoA racemase
LSTALYGIKVLDLCRVGPGPYCSMLLADFGADVTLVEPIPGTGKPQRSGAGAGTAEVDRERTRAYNAVGRGKRSIALNLKDPAGVQLFHALARGADVVMEGFRPGVVRRLGVDHETLSRLNPRIISCSISGYGQTGPASQRVGHDINYIAAGAALGLIGPAGNGPPVIPLNILADYAGGGLMAAFAICVAVIAREQTGRGQAIDLAMTDGVLSLLTSAFARTQREQRPIQRGGMLLNGGAHFYNVYRTSDGRWLTIGCLEPYFYDALCDVLELDDLRDEQMNEARWPHRREQVAAVIECRTADEWMTRMAERDIAASVALELDEIVHDRHFRARDMLVPVEASLGPALQVGVAPKLSETPGGAGAVAPSPGQDTDQILASLGVTRKRIAELRAAGTVA